MLMETVKPQGQEAVAEALTDEETQTLRESASHCSYIRSIDVRQGEIEVHLQGKIFDGSYIQRLGEVLYVLASHPKVERLVLEFGDVQFLSAATLGKYMAAKKEIQKHGGELIFTGMSPGIYEVFAITGLGLYFGVAIPSRERLEEQLAKERGERASAARSTLGDGLQP